MTHKVLQGLQKNEKTENNIKQILNKCKKGFKKGPYDALKKMLNKSEKCLNNLLKKHLRIAQQMLKNALKRAL